MTGSTGAPDVGSGYGEMLVGSLLVLGLVCLAAWVVVRFGARRLWSPRGGGVLDVLARVPLEPRRSLYVVEVAGKTLLVGTSEMGLAVLSELDGERVREGLGARPSARSFADALRAVLGRERIGGAARGVGGGVGNGAGDGPGNRDGRGSGGGNGDGNGDGRGNVGGTGDVRGDGRGSVGGTGDGRGTGDGSGDGRGTGDGSGDGRGDGRGSVGGTGDGRGSGGGDGRGDGNGDGRGSGSGAGPLARARDDEGAGG